MKERIEQKMQSFICDYSFVNALALSRHKLLFSLFWQRYECL